MTGAGVTAVGVATAASMIEGHPGPVFHPLMSLQELQRRCLPTMEIHSHISGGRNAIDGTSLMERLFQFVGVTNIAASDIGAI